MKIKLDTEEIKSELEIIEKNIEILNSVVSSLTNITNKKYDIKSVVRYRDEVKTLRGIIEIYSTYGKKDINTLMEQVGIVERVDSKLSTQNKITFKK